MKKAQKDYSKLTEVETDQATFYGKVRSYATDGSTLSFLVSAFKRKRDYAAEDRLKNDPDYDFQPGEKRFRSIADIKGNFWHLVTTNGEGQAVGIGFDNSAYGIKKCYLVFPVCGVKDLTEGSQ